MFLYGFVGSVPCGGLLLEKLQACTQQGLDGYGAALMQGGELLCAKSKESVAALAQQLPERSALWIGTRPVCHLWRAHRRECAPLCDR